MAVFYFKLEFVFDDTAPADASVFIQLRDNPPIYQAHTTKEEYDILDESEKNEFLTTLFEMAGVVELATSAYRIWLMKSPAYNWEEVLDPIVHYLMSYFEYDDLQTLPGSANIDGTGLTLGSINQRRRI